MSLMYRMKDKVGRVLRKVPGVYHIGHHLRVAKINRKKEYQRHIARKYGLQVMREVQDTLSRTGYLFFFTCGSLLGIIREHGMIKHDRDLDIAIMEQENFSWKDLQNTMEQAGFVLQRSFVIDDEIKEQTYFKYELGVDIFLERIVGEKMEGPFFYRANAEKYTHDNEFSYAVMHDTITTGTELATVYNGEQSFEVNVPNNFADVLYGNYGEQWQTPISEWDLWQAPNLSKVPEVRGCMINHLPLAEVQKIRRI